MKRLLFLLTIILFINQTIIFSQEKNDTDFRTSVLVSADKIEKSALDIPYSSISVDSDDIEKNIYGSLPEVLEDIPGFTSSLEYHSPIIFRGMRNFRMIFLKDGIRRMSVFNGGYMGQMEQLNFAQKIEVIKGAGSVIYGSGAIGGIINIVGVDVFEQDSFEAQTTFTYGANNNELTEVLSIGMNNDKFAMLLYGLNRNANDYFYGNNIKATNSVYNNYSAALLLGFRFNEKNTLKINTEWNHVGPWEKPFQFDNKNRLIDYENNNLLDISINYNVENDGPFSVFDAIAFYQYETMDSYSWNVDSNMTKTSEQLVYYTNQYAGINAYSVINAGLNEFIFGLDSYAILQENPQRAVDYQSSSTNFSDGQEGSGTADAGIYIQDTWLMSERIDLVLGVRYDIAYVIPGDSPSSNLLLLPEGNLSPKLKTAVSGNIGSIFHLSDKISLTLNLGRAFRMPKPNELFGEKATFAGVMLGNPALEPEYSWNIDFGIRGEGSRLQWDLALFANFIHNLINYVPVSDISGVDLVFQNIDLSRIIGGEFDVAYVIEDLLGVSVIPSVGLAYYRGDDFSEIENLLHFWKVGEAICDISQPRVKVALCFEKVNRDNNLYYLELIADSYLNKDRVPESELSSDFSIENPDSYTLYHINAGIIVQSASMLDSMTLSFSAENITDLVYYPYQSYIPGIGRNYKFLLSGKF